MFLFTDDLVQCISPLKVCSLQMCSYTSKQLCVRGCARVCAVPAALTLFKPLGMFSFSGHVPFTKELWALYGDIRTWSMGLWENVCVCVCVKPNSMRAPVIHIYKSKVSMSDHISMTVRRPGGIESGTAFSVLWKVPLANESLVAPYHFIWNLTISVKPLLCRPHTHTHFTHPILHSRLQSTFPPT